MLSQRLHLIAIISSAWAGGAGLGALTLNRLFIRLTTLTATGAGASRGTIVIAL